MNLYIYCSGGKCGMACWFQSAGNLICTCTFTALKVMWDGVVVSVCWKCDMSLYIYCLEDNVGWCASFNLPDM